MFVKVGVFVFVLAYRYSSTSSIYRQYYFDVNRTFCDSFLFIVSVILAMMILLQRCCNYIKRNHGQARSAFL